MHMNKHDIILTILTFSLFPSQQEHVTQGHQCSSGHTEGKMATAVEPLEIIMSTDRPDEWKLELCFIER